MEHILFELKEIILLAVVLSVIGVGLVAIGLYLLERWINK